MCSDDVIVNLIGRAPCTTATLNGTLASHPEPDQGSSSLYTPEGMSCPTDLRQKKKIDTPTNTVYAR